MYRPKQHVAEDSSRAAFELMVTSYGWTVNRTTSDYGIDCSVEMFQNGKTTGREFKVQLKSTSVKPTKLGEFQVNVSEDHIEYWTKYSLPVLVVLYAKQEEEFYAVWALSPRVASSNGAIRLGSPDRLGHKQFGQVFHDVCIEHDLRLMAEENSLRYAVVSESGEESTSYRLFRSTIGGLIQSHLGFLRLAQPNEPVSVIFTYAKNQGAKITLGMQRGLGIQPNLSQVEIDVVDLAKSCLAFLGGLLLHAGMQTEGRPLLLTSLPTPNTLWTQSFHFTLAAMAIDAGDVASSVIVLMNVPISNVTEHGLEICFEALAFEAGSAKNPLTNELSQYVREGIGSFDFKSEEHKGRAHRRLAYCLRFCDPVSALQDFQSALEISFECRQDIDLWCNLATVREQLGDLQGAFDAAQSALAINAPSGVQSYLGHICLHLGRLKEANNFLFQHMNDEAAGNMTRLEARLAHLLLLSRKQDTFERQRGQVEQMLIAFESIDLESMEALHEQCLALLELDPLCDLAWNALGAWLWTQKRHEDAHEAFVTAFTCAPDNFRAFVNVVGTIAKARDQIWSRLICDFMWRLYGDSTPRIIHEYIESENLYVPGVEVMKHVYEVEEALRIFNQSTAKEMSS